MASRSTLRGRPGIRATHVELDVPLADAVAAWLAAQSPWERAPSRPLSTAELAGILATPTVGVRPATTFGGS